MAHTCINYSEEKPKHSAKSITSDWFHRYVYTQKFTCKRELKRHTTGDGYTNA